MQRIPVRRASLVAALLALGLVGLAACETIERPRRADRTSVEGAVQRLAAQIETNPPAPADASARLRDFLLRRLEVGGASLVLADETGQRIRLVSMVQRRAGRLQDVEPPANIEDQEWFAMAREFGRPLWNAPYFEGPGMRVRMVTYSVPLYRDGRFLGVVAAHVPTE